jgi:hypothetical protein
VAGLDIGIRQARPFPEPTVGGERMQPLSESSNTDHSRHERTEGYRREAARVRAIADVTLDPQTRQELLHIARNYEILAMALELLPTDRSL